MTSVPSLNFQRNVLKQINMGVEEKTEMNHKYQLLSILENEKKKLLVFSEWCLSFVHYPLFQLMS